MVIYRFDQVPSWSQSGDIDFVEKRVSDFEDVRRTHG